MNYISVNAMNESFLKDPDGWIARGERLYSDQLVRIAAALCEHAEERPVILLAGPSGSGKTTSALRIGRLAAQRGVTVHTISMDNYFLPAPHHTKAVDENGNIDYESPYRLDIPLFNDHIRRIADCEEIEIPRFVFAEQKRAPGKKFRRRHGEMVIFEGIHALNPTVTGLSDAFVTGIYVSVRTRIKFGGQMLHPSKIRLMRRLIRDKLYRARPFTETMNMFDSVERGENLYIMPYKDRALHQVDTMIPFEAAVYRSVLLPGLLEAEKTYPDFARFSDVAQALSLMEQVPKKSVPGDSLIREFIGGSTLKY
ncbi:MAG: nucleoside kinase [Oscillospiraceae bacterium]